MNTRTRATLTATELEVLRFAPKSFRTNPVLRGYSCEVEGLATRGLLKIRRRNPWGINYEITPEGLAAVWDHAPTSIAHLRPEGV